MSKETQEPGILIHGISLIESSFLREREQSPLFEDNLSLHLETIIRDDKLEALVTLVAKLERINKDTSLFQVKAEVKYSGVFSKAAETGIDMDQFCKINAPAIMYPYIRNHFHEIFQKASLISIILPPINIQNTFKDSAIEK
jgi:preprotein translocase subunit SecB